MNDKAILRLIYVVSFVVFALVVILFNLPRAENIPAFVKQLPKINAFINAICFTLLCLSLYCIKKKNITMHKRLNITTFILSALFMLSYVTFHSYGIETKFPAENTLRPFYLTILLTHILLAAIVLPLVLISFYRGLKGDIIAHRKITRWSFPIWLYVTLSGVIVYLMISPYYTF